MIDLDILNEDSEFPCHDGDSHDYELDDYRAVCRRGCGAELLVQELGIDDDPTP